MNLPVTDQVSSSIKSQRNSIPQKHMVWNLASIFLFKERLSPQGSVLWCNNAWGSRESCGNTSSAGNLWVMFLRVLWWEVAVLSVGLKSSIRMLLEISSHCSTEKMSVLHWKQHWFCVTPNILQSWKKIGKVGYFFIAWKFWSGPKWCYFFSMKSLKNATAGSSEDLTRWNWSGVKRHQFLDFCLPLGQKAECREYVLKADLGDSPAWLVLPTGREDNPFCLFPAGCRDEVRWHIYCWEVHPIVLTPNFLTTARLWMALGGWDCHFIVSAGEVALLFLF